MLTIGTKHLRKRYAYPNNVVDIYSGSVHIWPYVTDTTTGSWVVSLSASPTTVSADGGTVTLTYSASRTITETWVNYSGNTSNYYQTTETESGTCSITTTLGTISGNTLTIPANPNTTIRSITVTATCGSASKSVTITQSAGEEVNEIESQSTTYTISLSASPTTIAAAGGTSTLTYSGTAVTTYYWTDGSTTTSTSSFTPTISGSATGFTRSGNTVTASENTSTSSRSVTYTASYSGATSKSVTITQYGADAPTIESQSSTYVISFSAYPTTFDASGGTSTLTCTGTKTTTYYWSDGDVTTSTSSFTPTISGSATGFTRSGMTVTVAALTSSDEMAESSRSVTYTASYSGATSKTVTITQTDEGLEEEPTISSYGDWIVTISANPTTVDAGGGTSSITRSAQRTVYWSDGSTTTEYGTPTLSISGSATLSGTTVTFAENTSTSSRTATVTATYEGATASITITQEGLENVITYDDWELVGSASTTTIPASGGTSEITAELRRAVYVNGEFDRYESADTTIKVTYDWDGAIMSTTAPHTMTLPENTTSNQIIVEVGLSATYGGKNYYNYDIDIVQEAKALTITGYSDWDIEITASSTDSVDAEGESRTVTVDCSRVVYWSDGTETIEYSDCDLTSSTTWAAISALTVSGDSGTATVTFAENTGSSSRSVTITATATEDSTITSTVTFEQVAPMVYLMLSPDDSMGETEYGLFTDLPQSIRPNVYDMSTGYEQLYYYPSEGLSINGPAAGESAIAYPGDEIYIMRRSDPDQGEEEDTLVALGTFVLLGINQAVYLSFNSIMEG